MKQISSFAVAAVAALIALAAAYGQTIQRQDASEKANGPSGGYSPGLGEIMSFQQMRHSKLWFAGTARNWNLAGYELDELKEGFEVTAKLFPAVNDVAVTEVISAIIAVQIPELGKSIEARDRAKFVSAFDRLTETCNACHQTTKHAFVVIQRPTTLPYTNQSFAPPPPGRIEGSHQH